MNGSNGETGRRDAGGAAAVRCAVAASRESTHSSFDSCAGGWCFICGRVRPLAASCEEWERIERFFGERGRGRTLRERVGHVVLCKDCCIGPLAGHGCRRDVLTCFLAPSRRNPLALQNPRAGRFLSWPHNTVPVFPLGADRPVVRQVGRPAVPWAWRRRARPCYLTSNSNGSLRTESVQYGSALNPSTRSVTR